jgi:hypothetical protein
MMMLLIVLAGCSSATAHTRPKTFIFGDSITQLATPSIHQRLPDATIKAYFGFTAKRLIRYVRSAIDNRAGVLVIEAGTDDALLREADWKTAQDEIVQLSRRVRCVWFVTVAEQPAMGPIGPGWNRRLRAAGVRLIDWNAAVAADASLAEPTGVHPSARGDRWLADAYAAAYADC